MEIVCLLFITKSCTMTGRTDIENANTITSGQIEAIAISGHV